MIENLDSLPMPAYDLIDLPAYWRYQSAAPVPKHRYVSLMTSRGCPYGCIWCHQVFGKRIRTHSAERVVEEIAHFRKRYSVNEIEFLDDTINFEANRIVRMSELLLKESGRIRMVMVLRGDILTQEVVDALVDAGTYVCAASLETGSPRLQRYIGKNLVIPRFLDGMRMLAQRRVFITGYCILGFPTETEEEMEQTIQVACQSDWHTATFYTATPFPGSPLYEQLKQTDPEKIAQLEYAGMDLPGMRVNLTTLPDEVLYAYQRKANRRFYFNPRRFARIVRDFPHPLALPKYAPLLLYRVLKGYL